MGNYSDQVYEGMGMIFIGPIIGLPKSIVKTFDPFRKKGLRVECINIFENQHEKPGLLKILSLTVMPNSAQNRITFANTYNEEILFKNISSRIEKLISEGCKNIFLGGMSGGFIFVSRIAQFPQDKLAAKYTSKYLPFIKGIFGVSPLIFYPNQVSQIGANLSLIQKNIPALLIWGDSDQIIPTSTIPHCEKISLRFPNINCRVIKGTEVGKKNKTLKHQFFGGRDFVSFIKNIFWNKEAEKIALTEIEYNLLDNKRNARS